MEGNLRRWRLHARVKSSMPFMTERMPRNTTRNRSCHTSLTTHEGGPDLMPLVTGLCTAHTTDAAWKAPSAADRIPLTASDIKKQHRDSSAELRERKAEVRWRVMRRGAQRSIQRKRKRGDTKLVPENTTEKESAQTDCSTLSFCVETEGVCV